MISVIIPTHNRAPTLRNCLISLRKLAGETDFEVVVVLNNCSDESAAVVAEFEFANAFQESATAFTRARDAGAHHARGDFLVFIDDDTIMGPGSLRRIASVFSQYSECGIIAGRIQPVYEAEPPAWLEQLQSKKNGLSLYEPIASNDAEAVFEVKGACGPLMAIRSKVYSLCGGFPPDTLGVETNKGEGLFSKIYIGPGDYGLAELVKRRGWKILYSPGISVGHVIPPMRLTRAFWLSRYFGEGCYLAIADKEFWEMSILDRMKKIFVAVLRVAPRVYRERELRPVPEGRGVSVEELEVFQSLAYILVGFAILRNRRLSAMLWRAGKIGVSDAEFKGFMDRIPLGFLRLISIDWDLVASSSMPVAATVSAVADPRFSIIRK